MADVNHDPITQMLAEQILDGISKIEAANEVLLDESGTGDREIDKAFKEGEVENKKAVAAWEKAEAARAQYRELLANARNLYRTEVLQEDAREEVEVDKDQLKEIRKFVLDALSTVKTYATANNKSDVVKWANDVEVPQVGRQGTSSLGVKRPRAHVSFDGKMFDSFGEAAKAYSEAYSTEDNKVSVGSADLVQAWSDANEAETFAFNGTEFTVTPKQKKSEAA